jgi:NAD-dependent deacetylase
VAGSDEARSRKTAVRGARGASAGNGGRVRKDRGSDPAGDAHPAEGSPEGAGGAATAKGGVGASPARGGDDVSPGIARLAQMVREADSVVALTGAGISVPSGIPDFRSPDTGTWQKVDPMKVAHVDSFRADPVRFWRFYGERFASLGGKLPNDAHHALVAMERRDMLDGVITQNVDMLHRKAGTAELVEVHGSIARCTCPDCGGSIPQLEVRARRLGDPDGIPRCEVCGGPLRPEVVLFGEPLSEQAMERARELCANASLILCIGSTLEVQPVGALPLLTHQAGGAIAILTQSRTPLDRLAVVRLDGDIVDELGALTSMLEIDDARSHPPRF